MKKKVIIGVILLVILSSCTGGGGPYEEFAQCLNDADVTMYGADWCGHCADQKDMFGEDFEYIDYVNCDFHTEECSAEGIVGYPTWKIGGKLLGRGVQTFDALAEASGCVVPEPVAE